MKPHSKANTQREGKHTVKLIGTVRVRQGGKPKTKKVFSIENETHKRRNKTHFFVFVSRCVINFEIPSARRATRNKERFSLAKETRKQRKTDPFLLSFQHGS